MFKCVDDFRRVERAIRKVQRQVAAGASRGTHTVATPHESWSERLYVREDLGIWMAPIRARSEDTWWCPFGLLPLAKRNALIAQFNPPRNPHRKSSGRIVTDLSGNLFLAHTGKFGGVRGRVQAVPFIEWTDAETVEVEDYGGKVATMFVVGQIGHLALPAEIAQFVRSVAEWKAGDNPRIARRIVKSKLKKAASSLESGAGGKREQPTYETQANHVVVQNALFRALESVGQRGWRDSRRERDLVIGPVRAPIAEFEIKTSPDSQSLYTAVGQLLVHGVHLATKQKVAVIPRGIVPEFRAACDALGIMIVEFELEAVDCTFFGLDACVPGAKRKMRARLLQG